VIGLPDATTGCLFDLDGVLTSTAKLHREAWKQTFDAFLRKNDGADFTPFTEDDYLAYVDGRTRSDGVRTFLGSRNIELPEGTAQDGPDADTVRGIGDRKNDLLLRLIDERGVDVYPGSRRYLDAARDAGLRIGVVTSSANGKQVLDVTGLAKYVDARVDGVVIERDGLRGKPAPDSFLAGAKALGVDPSAAAVFEDAIAGVTAGHAGGFGCVVGVDRTGAAQRLRDAGADVVVKDLGELVE
jgi:beta-phosphoglucomutase family hydrolase